MSTRAVKPPEPIVNGLQLSESEHALVSLIRGIQDGELQLTITKGVTIQVSQMTQYRFPGARGAEPEVVLQDLLPLDGDSVGIN
jgi:hypothetical protein